MTVALRVVGLVIALHYNSRTKKRIFVQSVCFECCASMFSWCDVAVMLLTTPKSLQSKSQSDSVFQGSDKKSKISYSCLLLCYSCDLLSVKHFRC